LEDFDLQNLLQARHLLRQNQSEPPPPPMLGNLKIILFTHNSKIKRLAFNGHNPLVTPSHLLKKATAKKPQKTQTQEKAAQQKTGARKGNKRLLNTERAPKTIKTA